MTTVDFITELFCRIDDTMKGVRKHPQALLYPSEIVTLGMLFALKGVGNRQFYRTSHSSPICQIELDCFGCSPPTRTGRITS